MGVYRKGAVLIPVDIQNPCSDSDCSRPHYAKGMCKPHYNSSLKKAGRCKSRTCIVEGCDRPVRQRLRCKPHYQRHLAGTIDIPVRRYDPGSTCEIEGCDGVHYAKGVCQEHYKSPPPESGYGDGMLRLKYGINSGTRAELVESQGGVCAICAKEVDVLCVDHDHTHCGGPRKGCSQCVRGMLCRICNTRLGMLEDAAWVEKAREYLASPPAYQVIERVGPKPPPRGRAVWPEETLLLKELGLKI